MAAQKFPATAIGVYFTAVHLGLFAVAFAFKGMAVILLLPYLPAEILWSGIGGDERINTSILAAAMLIALLIMLYLMYPFAREGYKKRTYVIVMTVMIFIVHPIAFYLYTLCTDFHLIESGVMSDALMNMFPVSSLAFIGIGSVIDKIVSKRMAISRSR